MKLLLLISFFISSFVNGQVGNRVYFVTDQDTFPDCNTFYPANGVFRLPQQEIIEIKLPNTTPVHPAKLGWNNLLNFNSYSMEAAKLGSLELDSYQIEPISREEIENLIFATTDSADYRRLIRDDTYLRENFGILRQAVSSQEPEIIDSEANYVPQNGILDGVYIVEERFIRIVEQGNSHIPNVFHQRREVLRSTVIQPKMDSLLRPFYFSNFEVTNNEYREFVNWVLDSISLQMAYRNLMNQDAALLLDCSKKERKSLDLSKKEENFKRFGLSLKNQAKIDDVKWIEAIEDMYYPMPERFYKRRELNVHKLIYRKSETEMIPIYPDTMGFVTEYFEDNQYYLGNLSTWHPYYGNYPVVNVSYGQIMAFCHWKQGRLNEEFKSDGYKITVRPPTITEYEFATKTVIGPSGYNLVLDQKNDYFVQQDRPKIQSKEALFYTAVNYDPFNPPKPKRPKGYWRYRGYRKGNKVTSYEFMLNYKRWYTANQTESPVKFLNGNVSEFVIDEVTNENWNHYRMNAPLPNNAHFILGSNYKTVVKTYGDDQYNAIFYKSALENNDSSPFVGFRLVYLVEKTE